MAHPGVPSSSWTQCRRTAEPDLAYTVQWVEWADPLSGLAIVYYALREIWEA